MIHAFLDMKPYFAKGLESSVSKPREVKISMSSPKPKRACKPRGRRSLLLCRQHPRFLHALLTFIARKIDPHRQSL
jgi:hypothetical protein